MHNKIDERLEQLQKADRKGLMTHVVVGYPSLDATVQLVETMADAGVDFVELQIPFSDPLADGPTIQLACEAALERGTKVRDAFTVARELSQKVDIPLLFMGYFNTVFKYGIEQFCADAAKAGIAGLIVPDVPLEAAEREGYLAACKTYKLHNVITLAPTSTPERLAKNAQIASGLAYCMSRQGVTGTQLGLDPAMQTYLHTVREHIKTPLAVGFGISNQERLEAVLPACDVAVVGSALIDRINQAEPEHMLDGVRSFLDTLTPALDKEYLGQDLT